MRNSSLLALLVLTGTAVLSSTAIGQIFLESNEIPNVCGLEVSVGPNAPDAPVQQFGDLEPPWRQEFDAAKICYRVSNPPDVCGAWTEWRCCASSGGETLCAVY